MSADGKDLVRIEVALSFGASGWTQRPGSHLRRVPDGQLCRRLPSAAGRYRSRGALPDAWAGDGDKDACDLAALAKGRTR